MPDISPASAVNASVTDGPIHDWLSLSYCNYQVIPRTLMQSMPTGWQLRMVACLNELHDAYTHIKQPEAYLVQAATEHLVSEMGFDLLEQAGIGADWYGGETPPEAATADDLAEWKAAHETPEPVYTSPEGQEMDPQERVLIPEPDPIPHYNRGRTFIAPKES